MKFIVITIFSFIVGCNEKIKSISATPMSGISKSLILLSFNKNPNQTFDLKMESRYNNAKWALYCKYHNVICNFDKDAGIKDHVFLSTLDLRLDRIYQIRDTVELYFFFYYKDSLALRTTVVRQSIHSGVGFVSNNIKISYFITSGGYIMVELDEKKQFLDYKIPSSNVKGFIRKNRNILNPWFVREAKKRGVL